MCEKIRKNICILIHKTKGFVLVLILKSTFKTKNNFEIKALLNKILLSFLKVFLIQKNVLKKYFLIKKYEKNFNFFSKILLKSIVKLILNLSKSKNCEKKQERDVSSCLCL